MRSFLGQHFEYSGECDLVFLRDKDFWQGLGLEIDVRTTRRYKYSYIEAAGIKIGDSILEGKYIVRYNQTLPSTDLPSKMLSPILMPAASM